MKQKHRIGIAGTAVGISGILLTFTVSTASARIDGKAVFDKNCSLCHSVMPPPKSAPPIRPIASRYRQRFTSKSQGVSHMVSFMQSPSKEQMVADPQAIDRFGLMPPMQLSDAELHAVAAWIWDQGTSGTWGPGAGKGQGNCVQKP